MAIQLSRFAYVTLGEAKEWARANIEGNPEDDALNLFINAASRNLDNHLNFEVVSRGKITEVHTIRRTDWSQIWLLQRPLIEVVSVHEDPNQDFNTDSLLAADEYTVDNERGMITRVNTGWPTYWILGFEVVQAIYKSGFADTESVDWEYKSLCLETVAQYYYHATRKQFAVSAIKDQAGDRTYMEFNFIPKAVKAKAAKFVLRRFGTITGRRVSTELIGVGTVAGTVDDGANPVVNATLVLTSDGDSDWNQVVQTDVNGSYSVANVPIGTVGVQGSKVGTGVGSNSGSLSEGATLQLDFTLS
jgi:hypothetical protein